jgi:putative DNA primase/helicase
MGSGKTLLADLITILVTGEKAESFNLSREENENEKRISSMLMQGNQVCVIDNVDYILGGAFLCRALSQEQVSCRILGVSKMITVNTNTVFIATGNNVQVDGDLNRRTLVIRLNPKTEKPYTLTFNGDIVQDFIENRHDYLMLLLSMSRVLLDRNSNQAGGFGSFTEWSNTVRNICIQLGLPDPILGIKAPETTDMNFIIHRSVLNLWVHFLGSEPVSTAEVAAKAGGELRELLLPVASKKGGNELCPVRLGKWLSARIDRIIDNKYKS